MVVPDSQAHIGAGCIVFVADQRGIACPVPLASVPEGERKVRSTKSDPVLFPKGDVGFCFISLAVVRVIGNLNRFALYPINELDVADDRSVSLGERAVVCRPVVKCNVEGGVSVPVDRRFNRFVLFIEAGDLVRAQCALVP